MNRTPKERISRRKSMRYRGDTCLNCGASLKQTDVYCPQCSQLNSTKPLSARDLFDEFLGIILFYDPRVRHTLWDLLIRPGVITRNYVRGQRLKYANPFRFFLSVSIVYFLLQGLIGTIDPPSAETSVNPVDSITSKLSADDNLASIFLPKFRGDTIQAAQFGIPVYYSESMLDTIRSFKSYRYRGTLYMNYLFTHEKVSPSDALRMLHHENTFRNRFLYSRMLTLNRIIDNPGAFIDYISTKIPFFLFFFAPIFALFFWIFYSRKKYTYMEHMIFIFHIFTFIFLVLLISLLPEAIFDISLITELFFFILGPIYFYKALRNFYQQRRGITIVKFLLLSIIFNVGLFLTTFLFVAASAMFY